MEAEFYDRLDDKRHALKTSFQEIGMRLLEGWLEGHQSFGYPKDTPHTTKAMIELAGPDAAELQCLSSSVHRNRLKMLAAILNSGNDNAIRAVTANLEVFSEYAEIKAAGKALKVRRAPRAATQADAEPGKPGRAHR